MTIPPILQYVQSLIGGKLYGPIDSAGKPEYVLVFKEDHRIFKVLEPYLILKCQQLKLVLEFLDNKKNNAEYFL